MRYRRARTLAPPRPVYGSRVERHLLDIVQLAWCRELSLDDDALTADRQAHARATLVDDTAQVVQVLRLGDTTAVVASSDTASVSSASKSGSLSSCRSLLYPVGRPFMVTSSPVR